jgi:hypothetical protein
MTKLTARNLAWGLSLAAAALAGTAYAEQATHAKRDADGNGVVTRAEVQSHSAAMFARMDANKDGKLDKGDREARRNALFDRMDTDKNGQLSRAEFGTRPQRPDGAVKGAEGGRKHHRWGGRGRGHHGMMMGRMADADKDGAVSQAEFTAAALQRFDRTDADKDGQVTKDERQAARKAMRDAWHAKREAARAAPAE